MNYKEIQFFEELSWSGGCYQKRRGEGEDEEKRKRKEREKSGGKSFEVFSTRGKKVDDYVNLIHLLSNFLIIICPAPPTTSPQPRPLCEDSSCLKNAMLRLALKVSCVFFLLLFFLSVVTSGLNEKGKEERTIKTTRNK